MSFERFSRFLKFIERNEINQNTEFVLDGVSFLIFSYQRSDQTNQLGCESHHYASYLQEQLSMSKTPECNLFFKLRSLRMERLGRICLIYMKNIYREVFDEVGRDYVICKYLRMLTLRNSEPAIIVSRGDPNWLSKGIYLNNVAVDYANLYLLKRLYTDRAPTGALRPYQDDPIRLSLHIIKYAYDLLTNFQNEGFTFVFNPNSLRKTMTVAEAYSIRRPEYEANVCVFENGWSELRELRLFEHFLKETVQLTDLEILDRLPEDARLLLIALVYFSRKKRANRSAEAASVLLSYVTLSVVLDKSDELNLPRPPFLSRPVLDSSMDKNAVTAHDCDTAAAIMSEYLALCTEVDPKLDREIVYPLEEFQYCLAHLNDLNALCGRPVAPTAFRRTYAGSLVFRLRCAVKAAGDVKQFLQTLLSPAPTVLAFLSGLVEAYEEMLLTCQ